MIQTCLAPVLAQGLPHTRLSKIRSTRYLSDGPGLIDSALLCLNDLDWKDDDLEPLSRLNLVSLELGALHPGWFNFSVAVFTATLPMGRSTVSGLRHIFRETLEALYSASTESD